MITLKIDRNEKHTISPYLYMQFMEPLGTSDTSVDAAWDFTEEKWHEKVIDKTRELAPTMIRFGGCFASYYHWKEAIGPQKNRIPMRNHVWDGMYLNQVGTHELVDFCRKVGAEPLIVANMESEGQDFWQYPKNDTCRMGTAEEAAEWVDYCNNPNNALRIANGAEDPFNVKYWQIGNETSYSVNNQIGFTSDQCEEVSRRFAAAMKKADPNIKLIAWGDQSRRALKPIDPPDDTWRRKMSHIDEVDMIAFHHHFDSGLPDCPFAENKFRLDPENTWRHFMHAYKSMETAIADMRSDLNGKRLAMTESHFSFRGKNRGSTLATWAAGVSYARCHNVIMRNSDVLDIATLADFCGNTWQSNALMIPTPIRSGEPYLMPVGSVMALFGRHQGKNAVDISYSGSIDAVASRTGNEIFIHVANTDMHGAQTLKLDIGCPIKSAKMEYIAADAMEEVTLVTPNVFDSKEMTIEGDTVTLPAAAVAAIRISF